MTVSGVSSSTSATSYLSSPAVQLAQFQGESLTTLLGGATGEPSDLSALTPTLVASSLYQRPGLLAGLTQWDGSMTPGSQRTAAGAATTPDPTATPTTPTAAAPASPFTFNPFDQASWWSNSLGSTVDTSA